MILRFTVDKTLGAPLPLRVFLRQKGISQCMWRKLKNNGVVNVNGIDVNLTRTMLNGGEEISVSLPEATDILPVDIPLDIIYEDEYLLVVNKPAGQLVHPVGKDFDNTIGNAVMGYYQRQGLPLSFHPVHRLDRNTSGLVLIAKQPNVQHLLTTGAKKLFQRHYLAVIPSALTEPDGVIDAPIGRKPGSIVEQEVSATGKPALTYYRVIDVNFDSQYSLLELTLATGRTHQIRVHLSHLGHPLVGDDLYGGSRELFSRQALHAYKMELTHPITKEPLTFYAPLPDDFQVLCQKLKLTAKIQCGIRNS